jgi:hypothetical protein
VSLSSTLLDSSLGDLELTSVKALDSQFQVHKQKTERTLAREAFFIDFASQIRKRYPKVLLVVTGGNRTRVGAEALVKGNICDLVGYARPAAINPDLPQLLLDESIPEEQAREPLAPLTSPWWANWLQIRVIGAGLESVSAFPISSLCTRHL